MATAEKRRAADYASPPIYHEYPIAQDYEINWKKQLGTGVSGPVRLCVHKASGEKRALKVLRDREKSLSEINLQWRCSGSEHMVRILDVYRNSIRMPGEPMACKRYLVVMELMEGGELFEFISLKKKFTEEEARKISVQIGEAIRHCHAQNIAHRDLKPENLLLAKKVTADDTPLIKLSDFGFAKVDNGDMTTPQFTPYYVAPQILQAQQIQHERARGRLAPGSPYHYDKSCDMWSFGVIIYIMLCGYPPFYSEIQGQPLSSRMKRKIMAGEYTFPKETWKNISSDAKDMIQKMLVVEPSDRMSIEEFFTHPWVKVTQGDELTLPSPNNFDPEQMQLFREAYAAVLAEIRREADDFQLCEPAQMFSANRIAQRRGLAVKSLQLQQPAAPGPQPQSSGESSLKSVTSMEVTLPSPPLQEPGVVPTGERAHLPTKTHSFEAKLQNIIDVCLMPPPPNSNGLMASPDMALSSETVLVSAVSEALSSAGPQREQLEAILLQHSWNGHTFTTKFDPQHLADSVRRLIPPN